MTNIFQKPSEDALKDLKSKYQGVEGLYAKPDEEYEITVRQPAQAEYDRWRLNRVSDDPQLKMTADREFVLCVVIYPAVTEVSKLFMDKPGLAAIWAAELGEKCGLTRTAARKKY